MMGFSEPYPTDDPNVAFIKNIHTTLITIGYKPVALAGNYRGIYVKKEDLETEALARGIKLETPIITL